MPLIHLATPDDVPRLLPLVECYWQFEGLRGFEAERIENLLRDVIANPSRAACWLALREGRVVGYLLAVFVFSLEHGGMTAEVDEFFVEPEARSEGIGSKLLEVAQRVLARAGYVHLQMQVGVENERGREFYRRNGLRARSGFELWEKELPAEKSASARLV